MYSFLEVHNRRNTRSVKWDALNEVFQAKDVLPMWVADMDFKAPEAVNEALINRAKHGIYGYTIIDDDIKSAIVQWLQKRHNWKIESDWLSFSPGVVTSLHMAIQAFTDPGDRVLIQTPVYTPFYKVIESHGREIVKCPLIQKDNTYTIDFAAMEEKLQHVRAFILCSPHNPVGRVWTKEELEKMAALCLKHKVTIISDEIHSDLVFSNFQHTPIASLSKEISAATITCMAPSKTFNLAGLQASYIVTENKEKQTKLEAYFQKQGISGLNTMGNTAIEAAYRHGEEWLNELLRVIESHKNYVTKRLEEETEELKVISAEGTYLLWIDCSRLGLTSEELKAFMINEAKVGLNAGVAYGEEAAQFMRMNIACPRATIEEGVIRIIEAVKKRKS
ncbi:MalY/PatB family protein [Virgibacillus sp. LDC-1]|uniref:MalY/PatB family protein n=1 Tax=Virgibacillus sp. LDC-1 TaxID=3039856 RepID=UPI0024DE6B93|nr:MalY/PatB family protein [Virgibacillus sp. LDC-1]